MTELGQVEIKKRLLSGVVDCELLSDTYDLISALQAEILELKADKVVLEDRISDLTNTVVKLPAALNDARTSRHCDDAVYTILPSVYKTKSERDDD